MRVLHVFFNLNEMLQLLIAPSKTSAVLYRGLYVLLPKLMYALMGTFGAKLSSDSGSHAPQSASAALNSSSLGTTASTSAVSQSASAAVASSSLGSASVVSQPASAAVVSSSLGSTSAVSQSVSSADVSSSSEFDSVGASSSRAC